MADTGCQSTLAGESILNKLGLNPSQLISTTTSMSAANCSPITISGALPLCISARSPWGTTHSTRCTLRLRQTKSTCLKMLALHYKSYQSHSPLLVLLTRQQHMQTMPRDVTVPSVRSPRPSLQVCPSPPQRTTVQKLNSGYWTTTRQVSSTPVSTNHCL